MFPSLIERYLVNMKLVQNDAMQYIYIYLMSSSISKARTLSYGKYFVSVTYNPIKIYNNGFTVDFTPLVYARFGNKYQ
jgi:hypothetical protein